MSDIIKFEPKPAKCESGDPNTITTTEGDVLNVSVDMPSPEFSKLDLESLFNIRQWVQERLEAGGALCIGAGIGCGGTMGIADIQIELDGHQYNIEVRPI